MEEVKYFVRGFISSRIIPAVDGGMIKSDDCVSEAIKYDVRKAAASMRREPPQLTKISTSPVVDIVDPHLFPFAFENTRTLRGGYISLRECILSCG